MKRLALAMLWGSMFAFTTSAVADVITYEWNEGDPGNGTNSPWISHHIAGGPVLADDFIPQIGGWVTRVDWWGSAGSSSWEQLFHTDAGGVPAAGPVGGGISKHALVLAAGADPDGDGVFFYSAAWNPLDVSLVAGETYWFCTANFDDGWLWANAGGVGPSIGGQSFPAAQSVGIGPDGGPHYGPWNSLTGQNFAFRVWVQDPIPAPAALVLCSIGVGFVSWLRRQRTL